jgi:membrane fusion protein (multidrug efflux system)
VFAAEASAPLRARAEVQRRVDAATQLVEVRIPISAPPAWLVVGARVRVRGVTAAREHATLVPSGALLHHGMQAGVFVVADGRARWRDVTLGARADGIIEVTAGVTSGERVATAGRSSLEDEMPVRVSSPASVP